MYIYDGGSAFDIEIAGLTGILPDAVTSTGTEIFINFVTDGSEATAGFRIQFDASEKQLLFQCIKKLIIFIQYITITKTLRCLRNKLSLI